MAAFTNRKLPVLDGAITYSYSTYGDYRTKAGTACTVSANGLLISLTTATDATLGILTYGGTGSSTMATLVVGGPAYFKAGSTCSPGEKLAPTSNGELIPTTTTGHFYCGICIERVSAGTYGKCIVLPASEHFKN